MTDPPVSATFCTTRWTQVLAAHGETEEAQLALGDLCAAYYGPVVAFLRAEGRNDDDARELAHDFFARLLERQSLAGADPARGRFRSYLLGALKHFLANHRAAATRGKRGGHAVHEPLQAGTDTSPGLEMPDERSQPADALFDREWAVALLDRALTALGAEWMAEGRKEEFEMLKPWLTGEPADLSSTEIARRLNLSDGALRVAIHRLRRRLREITRGEVAATVRNPEDVADELRLLIEALA